MTRVHAAAPVRLDFAGAWTDVAPFATAERGMVVSAAIALHAHAELTVGGDEYQLSARDLDERMVLRDADALAGEGPLELLRAAMRLSGLGPSSLSTWSDAPLGSGLGGSGALGVALVAAVDAAHGRTRRAADVAASAWHLETVEAGRAGGKQDQYSAAHGGFNRFTFERGKVQVRGLKLDPAFAALLARQTIVCYTGQSRLSSDTITRVMTAYSQKDRRVVGALRRLVGIADQMAEALEASDLARVGALLSENWKAQQQLDARMSTPEMQRLESAMRGAGAIGGKAAGSGAGGTMFFLVDGSTRDATAAAHACGTTILPLEWSPAGARTL